MKGLVDCILTLRCWASMHSHFQIFDWHNESHDDLLSDKYSTVVDKPNETLLLAPLFCALVCLHPTFPATSVSSPQRNKPSAAQKLIPGKSRSHHNKQPL